MPNCLILRRWFWRETLDLGFRKSIRDVFALIFPVSAPDFPRDLGFVLNTLNNCHGTWGPVRITGTFEPHWCVPDAYHPGQGTMSNRYKRKQSQLAYLEIRHIWTFSSVYLILLLGRKVMTNLDSILKSRDITLSTKVHLVKAMVFPVVMYGCESWTIKKAERQRIDAFELWCWRRLLRVPWTARRSNQSILKEISPGCSLEGLMLKLKLQYFGHLMRRTDSLEKTLMLGKIEGRRRRGQRRMRLLQGITDMMHMSLSRLRELVMDRKALCAAIHGVVKNETWLSDWTELNWRP